MTPAVLWFLQKLLHLADPGTIFHKVAGNGLLPKAIHREYFVLQSVHAPSHKSDPCSEWSKVLCDIPLSEPQEMMGSLKRKISVTHKLFFIITKIAKLKS